MKSLIFTQIDLEKEAKPMENMKAGLLIMIRGPGTFLKKIVKRRKELENSGRIQLKSAKSNEKKLYPMTNERNDR